MDQNEKQKYHQFLKKTMPFLVSVSLLSFLFSYSSAISHYFHFFSFRFSKLLFSHTLERKYIFLICNGIVAIIAKNLSYYTGSSPGFDLHDEFAKTLDEDGVEPVSEMEATVADLSYTGSSPGFDLHDEFTKTLDEDGVEPVPEMEATVADEEVAMESAVESLENVACIEEEKEKENGSLNIQGERESPALITVTEDEEYDEELEESGSLIPPSTAEDEVNVSTEELNRKCDEFIRKMKEEIRIEAQQQLITT